MEGEGDGHREVKLASGGHMVGTQQGREEQVLARLGLPPVARLPASGTLVVRTDREQMRCIGICIAQQRIGTICLTDIHLTGIGQ